MTTRRSSFRQHLIKYSGFLIIALLARLPHILGEYFVLDGDESIIGLMTLEFVQTGEFPLLFWGQNYGFTTIEVLLSSIPTMLFGLSASTLKLPMLLLFVTGVYFIYLTVRHLSTERKALLLAIFLLIGGTWFLWAMRIRGGYLTAFCLTHALIYFLLSPIKWSPTRSALLGFMVGVVGISQVLWFSGVFFMLVYALWRDKPAWKGVVSTITGVVIPFIPIILLYDPQIWWVPSGYEFSVETLSRNIGLFGSFYWRNLNGLYLHGSYYSEYWSINIYVWLCLIWVFMSISNLILKLKNKAFHWLMGAIIFSSIVSNLFLVSAAPRYALPLIGYLCIVSALPGIAKRQGAVLDRLSEGVLILLIAVSIPTAMHGSEIHYEDYTKESMNELLIFLDTNKVDAVFTDNSQLQWQIMAYSNLSITARFNKLSDRRPVYQQTVDRVYKSEPNRTALVSLAHEFKVDLEPEINWENNDFKLILQPDTSALKSAGFLLR